MNSQSKTKWVIAGIACAISVIAFFAVRIAVEAKLNPKVVQAELSKSLGLDVTTEQVKLGWTGRFELVNLRISSQSEPILSTPLAQVDFEFWPLLRREISIKNLALKKPYLQMNPSLAARLAKILSNRPPSKQSFPLTVSDGSFDYTAQNGRKISFGKIKGKIQLSSGGAPINLQLSDASGGLYQINGTVSAQAFNLQGKIKNITFNQIIGPLGINPVPEFQGDVSGRFSAAGKPDNIAVTSGFIVTSGLFKGNVTVAGNIESGPAGTVVRGKLYSGQGEIADVGAYKSFGMNFATPNQRFVFQDGVLEFPSGALQFHGGINKKNGITIGFKSSAFNPFGLPNFSGWGVKGSPGAIAGEASGIFPRLGIKAHGQFPLLEFGSHPVKNAGLKLAASLSSGRAALQAFSLYSAQGSFSAKGSASWDNQRNLHVILTGLNAGGLAKIFGLENRLSPMSLVAQSSIDYNHAAKIWNGTVTSGGGMIAGEAFNSFNGNFTYQPDKPLDFSGIFQMNGRQAKISGTWKNQVGNINLDAINFPVQSLPMAGGRFGGFHGIATVHAKFSSAGGASQADFSLKQASYRGRAIPDLSGTLHQSGQTMVLSPLRIALNPPLAVNLSYTPSTKAAQFAAHLSGQDTGNLLSLLPGRSVPMSGRLTGDLSGGGIYPNLSIGFSGTVRNAHFASFTMDEGKLSLHGTLPKSISFTFDTDRFDLSKFALIRQFAPAIEGVGSLHVSGGLGGRTEIGIHFNRVNLAGKSLGALDGLLSMAANGIRISRLTLPVTTPPLALAGAIDMADRSVSLSSKLDGQRISDLGALLHKSIGADGNLYGEFKAEGKLPRPALSFNGSGKNLKFAGMDIASATLSMRGVPSGSGYALKIRGSDIPAASVATLQKAFPGMTGDMSFAVKLLGTSIGTIHFDLAHGSWKGKAIPSLGGTVAWQAPVARFSNLSIGAVSPPIEASGEYNTETRAFKFGANLNGQNPDELVQLTGANIGNIGAKLYGPFNLSGTENAMNATFSGKAENLRFHGLSFGSGRLDLKAESDAQKHFVVHLSATGIPASSVAFLASHYPGISGDLSLNAALNTATPTQASLNFALTHASREGEAFPEVQAKGLWTSPTLEISPLTVGTSPELSLAGAVNTETQGLHLAGDLSGQSISSLMNLAGGSVSDVNGDLEGPLTIGGSTRAPELDFHGTVSNLVYKGVRLGGGRLDLASTSGALNGKLTLDRPISLNPQTSLLGDAISQIPGVGGIFGQVASNIAITGVVLRGSPHHPEVTPTIQRVAARQQLFSPQRRQQAAPSPSNPINSILNSIFH